MVRYLCALFLMVTAGQRLWAADGLALRHSNSLTLTAQAMGCSVRTVEDIRALDLDCSLSWVLMRLCAISDARPERILAERGRLSWGELCQSHGKTWAEMVQDVLKRRKTYGLVYEAPSRRQLLRSASNVPDSVPGPGVRP